MRVSRARCLMLTYVIAIYAFVLIPLLIVVAISFNAGSGFDFPPRSLSLRWYVAIARSSSYLNAFFRVSLVVGATTAVVATILGTLAALALARFSFRGRTATESLFLVPLLIPHILLGVALYLYFTRLGLSGSMFTLVVGHVLIATPFVIRNVTAGLAGLDPRIEEAAVNLGATRLQTFFLVVVPQIRSSLISGAVFAFIVSFSDVNVSLFLSGPGTTTLPVHLFSQLAWESDPSVAAASTVQILLIAFLLLLLQRVFGFRLAM